MVASFKYVSLPLSLLATLRNTVLCDDSPTPLNADDSENNITIDMRASNASITTTGPHRGCTLFLKEDHTPQQKLVGEAFEAISTSGYKVENEAGITAATCTNGLAGGYPCKNVDLLSMLDLSELSVSLARISTANDIWGWTDSRTGREFAIVGLVQGTTFVEITDPYNPIYLGSLETVGNQMPQAWRDVKTVGNFAYIVSEELEHGIQIFDLTKLLSASKVEPTKFIVDVTYEEFSSAHNIFINEDSKVAYVAGTNTCGGGLHMIDVNTPTNPLFVGCYSGDGYTHDVQCVIYEGPDVKHVGKEICFASNEDTVTIIDVTFKNSVQKLSKKSYPGDAYTHQGWLTGDHKYFIFNDELDEFNSGDGMKTRTHVMDVTDLEFPLYIGYHEGRTSAIDHNLYVVNDLVYQANYKAGLNILKISDLSNALFEEQGFFDIYPRNNKNEFNGAWSNYPYFPSGNIVMSGVEQGLFVLKYNAGCYEVSSDEHFIRTRKRTGEELNWTCETLRSKGENLIRNKCKRNSEGSLGPAKEVCKVTCSRCPNKCGEIDTQKFFLKRSGSGKFAYGNCGKLQKRSDPAKISFVCELVAPKESKFPSAKEACPVSCGACTSAPISVK